MHFFLKKLYLIMETSVWHHHDVLSCRRRRCCHCLCTLYALYIQTCKAILLSPPFFSKAWPVNLFPQNKHTNSPFFLKLKHKGTAKKY